MTMHKDDIVLDCVGKCPGCEGNKAAGGVRLGSRTSQPHATPPAAARLQKPDPPACCSVGPSTYLTSP